MLKWEEVKQDCQTPAELLQGHNSAGVTFQTGRQSLGYPTRALSDFPGGRERETGTEEPRLAVETHLEGVGANPDRLSFTSSTVLGERRGKTKSQVGNKAKQLSILSESLIIIQKKLSG